MLIVEHTVGNDQKCFLNVWKFFSFKESSSKAIKIFQHAVNFLSKFYWKFGKPWIWSIFLFFKNFIKFTLRYDILSNSFIKSTKMRLYPGFIELFHNISLENFFRE